MQKNAEACHFCGEQVQDDVFRLQDSDFSRGVVVRLCQGERRYSGRSGEIIGLYSSMFPGVFLVKLHDGSVLKVRYDHMMLAERIEKSKHYRELYEHRLAADKYEYPASNVQGNNA